MCVEAKDGRLFCNTADMHFGPQFENDMEAESFIRWCFADGHGDPRGVPPESLPKLQQQFREQQKAGLGPQEARFFNWVKLTPGIEHCTHSERVAAYLKAFPGRTVPFLDELVQKGRRIAQLDKPVVKQGVRIEAARDLSIAIHELLCGGGTLPRAVSCIEAALERLKKA